MRQFLKHLFTRPVFPEQLDLGRRLSIRKTVCLKKEKHCQEPSGLISWTSLVRITTKDRDRIKAMDFSGLDFI